MKILRVLTLAALAVASHAYADIKITELPAAGAITGSEPLPLVQAGSCVATDGTCQSTPAALTTYTLTQITSSTILGKFSGSCTLTSFMRGDGSCNAVSLTANVSGILPVANGGTNNAFFTVAGPATSAKTYTFPNATANVLTDNAAVTAAQGGTGLATYTIGDMLYATSTTALAKLADAATGNVLLTGGVGVAPSYGKVGLTTHVTGTLPVANGGIGAATLTGIAKGNGTSAFTVAVNADVIGLWTGSCSSSTYLRGDGACGTPAGSGTVTSVGLTMPSIFSISGSPITSTGTLAVTAAGTSGGVPYFASGTTLASSAALTAHGVVIGGGAATAPTSTSAGTAGQIMTSNGASADPTFQSGVDLTGLPAATAVARADLGLIYSQADTQSEGATFTLISTGVLGNAFTQFTGPTTSIKTFTLPNATSTILTSNAAVTLAQGGVGITSVTSGGVLYGSSGSAIASSAALAANALVIGGGAGVAPSTTATINNGTVVIRINPRVQTAADATSVTPTGDTADQTIQANTQTAGTLTMAAPTGTPVAGQKWIFRIKSTNVQTFSWNAIYRGSAAGALPTVSSGSSLTDYFGFLYNATDSKWDFVSQVKGF